MSQVNYPTIPRAHSVRDAYVISFRSTVDAGEAVSFSGFVVVGSVVDEVDGEEDFEGSGDFFGESAV